MGAKGGRSGMKKQDGSWGLYGMAHCRLLTLQMTSQPVSLSSLDRARSHSQIYSPTTVARKREFSHIHKRSLGTLNKIWNAWIEVIVVFLKLFCSVKRSLIR